MSINELKNIILKDRDIIDICNMMAECYRNQLKKSGHIATGNLYNFTWEINIDRYSLSINFNLPDYWYYVEHGRNAGKMPPLYEIERWLRIKNILPRANKGKIPAPGQLAFMISRNIGKKGVKGTHDLSNAEDDMNILFIRLKNLIENLVNKYIINELTEIN